MNVNRIFACVVLLLAVSVGAYAQIGEPTAPVVEAARAARNSTVKAKTVITNETVLAGKSPIPDVSRTVDNSAEIFSAIVRFYNSHTPAMTELKAKEWYALQDSEMVHTVLEASSTDDGPSDRCESADEKDAAACERQEQRRMREASLKKSDLQAQFWRMNATIRRVRFRLAFKGLKYDWMVEREFPPQYEE